MGKHRKNNIKSDKKYNYYNDAQLNQLLNNALSCQQSGYIEQAIKIYQQILRMNPKHTAALFCQGKLYVQMGKHTTAVQYFSRASKIDPDNPEIYFMLGTIQFQSGKIKAGIKSLKRAIEIDPNYIEAYCFLATIYQDGGMLQESVSNYQKAIDINPDIADIHNNLGIVYKELGEIDKAISSYNKAIRIKKDYASAHNNLGNALKDIGKHDEAIKCFKRAIAINPDYSDAYNNLGLSLHDIGKYEDAVSNYLHALDINPDNPIVLLNLGNSYIKLGHINKAISIFKRSIDLNPDIAELHRNLGAALIENGEFNVGIQSVNAAISIKPIFPLAYLTLAQAKRFTLDDKNVIDTLEKQKNINGLSDEDKIILNFALGKIYDDCKLYDKAFECYKLGNNIRHETVEYNRGKFEDYINRIINICTKDYFNKYNLYGHDTNIPIFIIGMPRSGTTLVEQILASHPDVYGAGELEYFTKTSKELSVLFNATDHYPDNLSQLSKDNINTICVNYLRKLGEVGGDAKRIVDKMPTNFLHLGLIYPSFPNSHIIYCYRNPLDTCLSNYFQLYEDANFHTYLLTDICHYYLEHNKLMRHWKKNYPSPILEIKYEDLITDIDKTSRKIIKYCNLEWNDHCLSFQNCKRDIATASNWQVRQPLYKSSINRWKNYEKYIDELKNGLKELMH